VTRLRWKLRDFWFWNVQLPAAYWIERARYATFARARDARDVRAAFGPWSAWNGSRWYRPELCVGYGWHEIVRDCLRDMYRVGWRGGLVQVKEKFGGLRVYAVGDGYGAIWHAIRRAESRAASTCERCGAPGRLRGRGWLTTSCAACWEKRA
jgi:hypothetical protein